MAASKKGKQVVISVSSSSSEEEEEDEDDDDDEDEDEEEESEEEYEEESDEDQEEEPLSEDGGETSDDVDDDGSEGKPTDEELCNKVVDLLRRGKSLNILKLEECKAYLRKHELRISGTKATCIERILEHWRIKDGNGEKLYPKSSFVIHCTGDVCKGDVVLFKQRVYEKFDIVKRGGGGNIIGKRMIAGRVVKESYGAAKQQHTFTVEVLWSKGVKALPPLSILLVKGRNLYRLKTFRQRWINEVERSKVLAEKHRRGAAARHVRSIAKARSANRGSKRQRNSSTPRLPPNKRRKELEPPAKKKKENTYGAKAPSKDHAKMKQVARPRNFGSPATHPKQGSYPENGSHPQPPFPHRINHDHNYYHPQMELYWRNSVPVSQPNRSMFHLPSYNVGYTSAAVEVPHHRILNMDNYISHPISYPNPRRQVNFDDGVLGGRFHGWRRP